MEMENSKANIQEQSSTWQIAPARNTTDLILCEPIINHKDYAAAAMEIGTGLSKAALSLDIPITEDRVKILIEDIIEQYKFESVELILFALQKGRRGNFGPTYGKLNLEVIQGWMTEVLEDVAREREQQHQNRKTVKNDSQLRTSGTRKVSQWIKAAK